jgi:hypothetical protein
MRFPALWPETAIEDPVEFSGRRTIGPCRSFA